MKPLRLLVLLVLSSAVHAGITNVNITPPADTLPVAFGKINANFTWLLENGAGGSNAAFVLKTNGLAYSLIVSNGLTYGARWITPPWLEVPPIDLPIDTNAPCTNTAGPYYPDPGRGPNAYTNECDFVIWYTNLPPEDPYTNVVDENFFDEPGLLYLYTLTVSGLDVKVNGSYTWTNGAFYRDSQTIICSASSTQHWWAINYPAESYRFDMGTSLLDDFVATNSHSTNWGIQARTFIPQFDWFEYGAGTAAANGRYYPAYSQDGNWYWWTFTNSTKNLQHTLTWHFPGTVATGYQQWYNSTDRCWWDLIQEPLDEPGPCQYKLQIPHLDFTALLIVPPWPDDGGIVTPGPGGQIEYHTNGVCTYLVHAKRYLNSVHEANLLTEPSILSSLSIDGYGTAVLVLFSATVKVMPQTDSTEWQPCP
jgi:hypothetical protein